MSDVSTTHGIFCVLSTEDKVKSSETLGKTTILASSADSVCDSGKISASRKASSTGLEVGTVTRLVSGMLEEMRKAQRTTFTGEYQGMMASRIGDAFLARLSWSSKSFQAKRWNFEYQRKSPRRSGNKNLQIIPDEVFHFNLSRLSSKSLSVVSNR